MQSYAHYGAGNGGQALHPQLVTPYPGIKTRYGAAPPPPGHVILRYEVRQPGCCECENLSFAGWIAVIILFIIFWPLCWIPFVCPACYSEYQVPVYGAPDNLGVYNVRQYPVAHPYSMQPQPSGADASGTAMGVPVSGDPPHQHHYPPTATNPYPQGPQYSYQQRGSEAPAEPSAPPITTAFVGQGDSSSTLPSYSNKV